MREAFRRLAVFVVHFSNVVARDEGVIDFCRYYVWFLACAVIAELAAPSVGIAGVPLVALGLMGLFLAVAFPIYHAIRIFRKTISDLQSEGWNVHAAFEAVEEAYHSHEPSECLSCLGKQTAGLLERIDEVEKRLDFIESDVYEPQSEREAA